MSSTGTLRLNIHLHGVVVSWLSHDSSCCDSDRCSCLLVASVAEVFRTVMPGTCNVG